MNVSSGYAPDPHFDAAFKEKMLVEGVKLDQGKLRYDLIPVECLEELALVYTLGAVKYDDDNWRKGMDWKRIEGALMRHLQAWRKGESRDADGFKHLAAVAWCAFTLMYYEQHSVGTDTRWY